MNILVKLQIRKMPRKLILGINAKMDLAKILEKKPILEYDRYSKMKK